VIRVVLAAHQAFLRRGLCDVLSREADITVAGEASDAATVLAMCRQVQPDVAVLGQILLTDSADGGLVATRRMRARGLAVPTLLIASLGLQEEETAYLLQALQAGASGFIQVQAAEEELAPALRIVHQGEVVLYPSAVHLLLTHYLDATPDASRLPGLSSDEQTILQQTAAGANTVAIAWRLQQGPSQVRQQQRALLAKLGLTQRAALVRYASERGLL
jgi:DNA-binding NarL/FixJ family response regulator